MGQFTNGRLVYFRSTDIEQKNYRRLLWSIPDEWFYLLSEGKRIYVIDKSTKKAGKVERIFIPVINDVFNKMLLNIPPRNNYYKQHFDIAMQIIHNDGLLMKKFTFWKDKIKEVSIIGKTVQVEKEPNPLIKHNVTRKKTEIGGGKERTKKKDCKKQNCKHPKSDEKKHRSKVS